MTDVTDASNASKYVSFNNPIKYENDLRNVQEVSLLSKLHIYITETFLLVPNG